MEILSELVKRIEFKKILPWQGQRISQPKQFGHLFFLNKFLTVYRTPQNITEYTQNPPQDHNFQHNSGSLFFNNA